MKYLTLTFVFYGIYLGLLNGQITLTSSNNSPKGNYRYIYDTVVFNYSNALPFGTNISWNIPDLEFLEDTMSYYFTRNPNYISFPGYPIHSYPDPDDTSYLYSDYTIYRTTDTLYSQAYRLEKPPIGGAYAVEECNQKILRYPFPYQYTMYEYAYSGQTFYGFPDTTCSWKKSEAWGALILPDTVYPSTLRIQTYRYYFGDYGPHSGSGSRIQTLEWFDQNSELCILSLTVKELIRRNYSPPYTYFKDTVAIINTQRIYSPCTLAMEYPLVEDPFQIYPNPASTWIILNSAYPGKISISDVHGYELIDDIIKKGKTRIDISNLSVGLFFVNLSTKTQIFSKKFIKE